MSISSYTSKLSGISMGGFKSPMMNKSVIIGDEEFMSNLEYHTVVFGSSSLTIINPAIVQQKPLQSKQVRFN